MYPVIRMFKEYLRFARAPSLGPGQTHVSHHRCWPWDVDLWAELNNGRTLTLFDLGRIVLFRRVGLLDAVRRQGLGLTVAGATVRYRRRITPMARFRMESRLIGWDNRFFYIHQSMWRGEEAANACLLRIAAFGPGGIAPPADVARAAGLTAEGPALPDWVTAWIAAEDARPWPPER